MAKKKAAKAASRKGVGKVITKAVAEKWLKHSASVDLSAFQQLDDEAAKVLSEYKGFLELNGLTQLSDISAKSLGTFKGYWLELNGLADVSENAARNLAKTTATLKLNGLKDLSDAVAKALSAHPGSLELGGLEQCSDEAVRLLARIKDDLDVGLPCLTDSAAKALASFQKRLTLSRIRAISDVVSRSLEKLDRDGRLKVSDRFCKTMTRLKELCPGWKGLLRFAGWTLSEKKIKWKDVPENVSHMLHKALNFGIDANEVKITKITLKPKDRKGNAEEYFVGEFTDDSADFSAAYVVNTKEVVAEFEN